MIRFFAQAAVLVVAGLALGGCPMGETKTAVPAKKPPAPDYQAPVGQVAKPTNLRAICYTDADLAATRSRMVQQEMSGAALQCQNPGGGRALQGAYESFIGKFSGELATNARSLQQLAGRKRFNVDVLVTEIANRTAQKAPVDREFCTRSQRTLEWALSPQVTSLAQVPPPYDLGPEMNIHSCTAP
ncbi:MAG: hypothetical protein ACKOEC_08645 [Acidimicrobiia bacterium]